MTDVTNLLGAFNPIDPYGAYQKGQMNRLALLRQQFDLGQAQQAQQAQNAYRSLAPDIFGATTPEQQQSVTARAGAIDPSLGFNLQDHFAKMGDAQKQELAAFTEQMARDAYALKQIPDPAQRAQAYQAKLAQYQSQGHDVSNFAGIPADQGIMTALTAAQKVSDLLPKPATPQFQQDPQGNWFGIDPNTYTARPVMVDGGQQGAPQAPSGFDADVNALLQREGGYKATDGNSGNPVNFGINGRANPGVDIKNLTRDQAIGIYRDKYWNAIGADNLPPAIQNAAFDAAVNMGPEVARQLVQQSGGDPAKFAQLRAQAYQQIVQNDPSQAKYLQGWLARNAATTAQGSSEPSLPPAIGMVAPGNIKNIFNRPILNNPDGSYSTTSSMSFSEGGPEILIPTVVDGRRLTQQQAIAHYRATGEFLGKFDTPEHADAYATALHNQQAAYIEQSGQRNPVQPQGQQFRGAPKADKTTYRPATPADLQALGLPPETKGQMDTNGQFHPFPQTTTAGSDLAKTIAKGIINGDQPPVTTGLYRYGAAVREELEKQGFNLSKANQDWVATQRLYATMNGTQQTRLRQAVTMVKESIPLVRSLAAQWNAGSFPPLNKVNLIAAKNGLYGKEAQSLATRLDTQIADMTSETGVLYMGGNSPTDHALELAAKQFSGNWSEQTFQDSMDQLEQNIRYRDNSINNLETAGIPQSQYNQTAAPQSGSPKIIRFDAQGNRLP